MRSSEPSASGWISAGLYACGALLVFFPALDLITTVLPLNPGDFQWRYGFLGLAPGYFHTPVTGVAMVLMVAFWFGHNRTLRWFSVLTGLSTLALLLAMGVFTLDVIQMRGIRSEAERPLVMAGGILQGVKYLTTTAVLALLTVGGWRTASMKLKVAAQEKAPAMSPGVVTGSPRRS